MVLGIGLQTCGRQPESVQSWLGWDLASRYPTVGSVTWGGSPATCVVRSMADDQESFAQRQELKEPLWLVMELVLAG